jgi:DNA gyrase/topoisomerase IV subunit B|tara:strand:- start:1268 stop:1522 length:255 start_codon:yes stop_codon:yes gene_type:complete
MGESTKNIAKRLTNTALQKINEIVASGEWEMQIIKVSEGVNKMGAKAIGFIPKNLTLAEDDNGNIYIYSFDNGGDIVVKYINPN